MKELEALIEEQFPSALTNTIKYITADILGNIQREAPTDHGRLAGSYDMKQVGPFAFGIWSNVEYRWWAHEGTGLFGPYKQRIRPRTASALVFYWDKIGKTAVFLGPHPRPRKPSETPSRTAGEDVEFFFCWPKGKPEDRYIDRAIALTEPRTGEFVRKAINEVKI